MTEYSSEEITAWHKKKYERIDSLHKLYAEILFEDSHDLKASARTMGGNASLVLSNCKESLDDDSKDRLQKVVLCAKKMNKDLSLKTEALMGILSLCSSNAAFIENRDKAIDLLRKYSINKFAVKQKYDEECNQMGVFKRNLDESDTKQSDFNKEGK